MPNKGNKEKEAPIIRGNRVKARKMNCIKFFKESKLRTQKWKNPQKIFEKPRL